MQKMRRVTEVCLENVGKICGQTAHGNVGTLLAPLTSITAATCCDANIAVGVGRSASTARILIGTQLPLDVN